MASFNYNSPQQSQAAWIAEPIHSGILIPGGDKLDPAQFLAEDGQIVTVGSGGAAVDATSIPVEALEKPLPAGTNLHFGGKKFANITVAAAATATNLTSLALPTALVAGDKATYFGLSDRKPISAGILLGRTEAEAAAGTAFGPADVANDDEIYLLAFAVSNANHEAEVTLLRHNTLIRETKLPDWGTYSADEKAKIRELYQCLRS